MARCTLDDLVPSVRCNRVFLEPISSISESETQSFVSGVYSVSFDLSVYDIVDDENGIANYLLTDKFKNQIKYKLIYCRDDSFKELCDLFKSNRAIPPSIQSYLLSQLAFNEAVEAVKSKEADTRTMLNYIMDNLTLPGKDYLKETSFYNKVVEKLTAFYNSDCDIKPGFTDIPSESHGARFFNDKGQIEYDLKIPLGSVVYENSTSVKDCYLYIIPSYDLVEAYSELGFEQAIFENMIDEEAMKFFFKEVHRCPVLINKKPANDTVQDFRLVERIAEIMDIDRITDYDATVDKISSVSDSYKTNQINITSQLFNSFVGSSKELYIISSFYLNTKMLLIQNSKFPFIYKNLYEPKEGSALSGQSEESQTIRALMAELVSKYFNIDKMSIFRERVDEPGESVRIAFDSQISAMEIMDDNVGYSFVDNDFKNIDSGEYKYRMELELHDPMENVVEELVLDVKKFSNRFKKALKYINNSNSTNNQGIKASYNEMRDELSQHTINEILSQNPPTSAELKKEFLSFQTLFAFFTGELFSTVSTAMIDLQKVFRSRKLMVNIHRVVEDMLFEVQKYYETKDVTNASLSSNKPSSYIFVNKVWSNTVKAKQQTKMILDLIGKDQYVLNESAYAEQNHREASAHYGDQVGNEFGRTKNIGCFTPKMLDDQPIYQGTTQNAFLAKLSLDLLEMPITSPRHKKVIEDFFGGTKPEYSEEEMKNNYGAFETMLTNLGVTITNTTLKKFEFQSKMRGETAQNPASYGIEDGSNVDTSLEIGGIAEFEPTIIPADEELLAEQDTGNTAVSHAFYSEFLKKEDLASKIVCRGSGYNAFDRLEFTQGAIRKSFQPSYISFYTHFHEAPRRAQPLHFEGERIVNLMLQSHANETEPIVSKVKSRLLLDNTFLVYYLHSFDKNMQPQWRHLVDYSMFENQFEKGRERVLCKLKRYQSSMANIGQGALSDRDIFLEYFYLRR
ncbi:MAG: hypothetical protein GOVbin703_70 [Prokaryotic dsDNA virus sp.]|nr:MAG: hypothetical protein GOVbin703_70 [Prokaryotic dsDNA virus sp.]|tara:strand:+ start:22860 stop:25751 length:2892 start_codon:yes stop_codon:yes gene_type:complete